MDGSTRKPKTPQTLMEAGLKVYADEEQFKRVAYDLFIQEYDFRSATLFLKKSTFLEEGGTLDSIIDTLKHADSRASPLYEKDDEALRSILKPFHNTQVYNRVLLCNFKFSDEHSSQAFSIQVDGVVLCAFLCSSKKFRFFKVFYRQENDQYKELKKITTATRNDTAAQLSLIKDSCANYSPQKLAANGPVNLSVAPTRVDDEQAIHEHIIKENEEDVIEIWKTVQQINQCSTDTHTLVMQGQEPLDIIVKEVASASHRAQEGSENMKEASQLQGQGGCVIL